MQPAEEHEVLESRDAQIEAAIPGRDEPDERTVAAVLARRVGAGFPVEPAAGNLLYQFEVAAIRTVGRQVGFGRIGIAVAIDDRVNERAKDGFGVVPANVLQRAKTVGNVDFLVPDLADIAAWPGSRAAA